MSEYVDTALFVYAPETEHLRAQLLENPFQVTVSPVALDAFLEKPKFHLSDTKHVVFSGPLEDLKRIIHLAMEYDFSIGLIPAPGQKDLISCYALPGKTDAALDVALHKGTQVMDVILCNKQILLFKATVGRLPMIDYKSKINEIRAWTTVLRRLFGLKLLPFQFSTGSGKKIKTAVCGCMIVQHHERTLASRLISHDSSLTDGMISMVVAAPMSILSYFNFLFQIQMFRSRGQRKKIPDTIGYIKSSQISIETEKVLDVYIDGELVTQTPLHCETVPGALRINVGEELRQSGKKTKSVHERIEVRNLPAGKELVKAANKRITLFSYASEERFRDLFILLREDAKTTPIYMVLMVLSTMLAAVGLYQSSSAVVIGAMLLAPLMSPIVSLAMGLLRQDTKLSKASMLTIAVGVLIALSAASLISLLFPHKPITTEMQTRLHPSLLDLGVAIVAGIAGAYTKSHKEILQSLAGVSIAVALVPPLAVAGIGLGMRDFDFFSHAFLLFSTNLIGIILAATLTFRILGFSPVVRNKRGLALVTLFLVVITIPLYFSYRNLVEATVLEKSWQQERFLLNDKYLIVQQAEIVEQRNSDLIFVRVLVREPLNRNDLNKLRKKIQSNFADTLSIRVQVLYIP